jgi:hypothetical protein
MMQSLRCHWLTIACLFSGVCVCVCVCALCLRACGRQAAIGAAVRGGRRFAHGIQRVRHKQQRKRSNSNSHSGVCLFVCVQIRACGDAAQEGAQRQRRHADAGRRQHSLPSRYDWYICIRPRARRFWFFCERRETSRCVSRFFVSVACEYLRACLVIIICH